MIQKEDLNKSLHFEEYSHFQFLSMCILAGCDYCESLPGVGIKRAHKVAGTLTESNFQAVSKCSLYILCNVIYLFIFFN